MYVTQSDAAFVRASLDRYFAALAAGLDDAPSDLRTELAAEFQVRPGGSDLTGLRELESHLPAALPPAFRAYLSVGQFRGVEAHEYYLPSVREPHPLWHVSVLLLTKELWPCGYLQFGHGQCGDPLCFDFCNPRADGDYPVVVFNHDIIPATAWVTRVTLKPHAQAVAPSFRNLLAWLCGSARTSAADGDEA
jgi:hypothetical protein